MKRRSRTAASFAADSVTDEDRAAQTVSLRSAAVAHFFSLHPNPVSVSNLIAALAAGTPLRAATVPVDLLPAVVLLATAGLRAFDQQIVDDYAELIDRGTALVNDKGFDVACRNAATGERYFHVSLNAFVNICMDGPRGEYFLGEMPETRYIEQAYKELVDADADALFQELNANARSFQGDSAPHVRATVRRQESKRSRRARLRAVLRRAERRAKEGAQHEVDNHSSATNV